MRRKASLYELLMAIRLFMNALGVVAGTVTKDHELLNIQLVKRLSGRLVLIDHVLSLYR